MNNLPKEAAKNRLTMTASISQEMFYSKYFDKRNIKVDLIDRLSHVIFEKTEFEEEIDYNDRKNFIGSIYMFTEKELLQLISSVKEDSIKKQQGIQEIKP